MPQEDNDIKKYIYLPVPTLEWATVIHSWNGQKKANLKQQYLTLKATGTTWVKGLRRACGLRALRNVRPKDRLYVLLHGVTSEGMKFPTKVGANRKGKMVDGKWKSDKKSAKFYTPQELADHLAAEGLNRRHVQLDLFSCSAGLGDSQTESFAQRLSRALSRLGYRELTVVGYIGNLEKKYGVADALEGDERRSGNNSGFAVGEHKLVWLNHNSKVQARLKHGRVAFRGGKPVTL